MFICTTVNQHISESIFVVLYLPWHLSDPLATGRSVKTAPDVASIASCFYCFQHVSKGNYTQTPVALLYCPVPTLPHGTTRKVNSEITTRFSLFCNLCKCIDVLFFTRMHYFAIDWTWCYLNIAHLWVCQLKNSEFLLHHQNLTFQIVSNLLYFSLNKVSSRRSVLSFNLHLNPALAKMIL